MINCKPLPSTFQSIDQQFPIPVTPLHQKERLRVQGRELFSVRTCCSIVTRLSLRLLLLASWDLRCGWKTTVDWVVEESSNVVDEEGVKRLGDLFLVGEFKGTLERNPDDVSFELQ